MDFVESNCAQLAGGYCWSVIFGSRAWPKDTNLKEAPRVLVLHLKRFVRDPGGGSWAHQNYGMGLLELNWRSAELGSSSVCLSTTGKPTSLIHFSLGSMKTARLELH